MKVGDTVELCVYEEIENPFKSPGVVDGMHKYLGKSHIVTAVSGDIFRIQTDGSEYLWHIDWVERDNLFNITWSDDENTKRNVQD